MKNVLTEVRRLLADVAQLQKATLAAAVAGVVAPILASILGATLTAPEVTGWLVLAGGVAATIERLTTKAAAAPVPPAPPASPAAPADKKGHKVG